MGVTSLWQIVSPCSRPVKIDTLNKKRLSVDASIWVYHFLKAVRDKEGNALRNSHIVGFYRRICKLLYFGIKPVFVFDGGAPALKRQTITGRKNRREGRREDAVRTAGKLLAMQMQRRAEDDEQNRTAAREEPRGEPQEEAIPENLVYVDEIHMTNQERQESRKFKKKDQYHLPDLDVPLSEMGSLSDPRVMSLEELQQYARQFETGEDINVYDFSKIDFDSPFFTSLPPTDRYNILNAARLRSRLRMGYSREQLDSMFPDRMAFSRFQIERVRERNELTQRLMRVGTAEDGTLLHDGTGRVAGERGREYVLVKNPDVEGGWALGVIGEQDQDGRDSSRPIDIEAAEKRKLDEQKAAEESSDEEPETNDNWQEALKRREEFYNSRQVRDAALPAPVTDDTPDQGDGLFISEGATDQLEHLHASSGEESEDDETQMQIAIAMSVQAAEESARKEALDRMERKQKKAPHSSSFAQSRGKAANLANTQSRQAVAHRPATRDSPSDDEQVDFQKALAASRPSGDSSTAQAPGIGKAQSKPASQPKKFDGPLPFEKLDLGSSLLGKKKMQSIEESNAGGFERKAGPEDESKKKAVPAPPWFSADVEEGIDAQREMTSKENHQDEAAAKDDSVEFQPLPSLRRKPSNEVIDVDAPDDTPAVPTFIDLDSSEDEGDRHTPVSKVVPEDDHLRMGDLADAVRVEPPLVSPKAAAPPSPEPRTAQEEYLVERQPSAEAQTRAEEPSAQGATADDRSDEEIEWEKSDDENAQTAQNQQSTQMTSAKQSDKASSDDDDEDSDEDLYIPTEEALEAMARKDSPKPASVEPGDEGSATIPMSGVADQNALPDTEVVDDEGFFSDSDDEELMMQLANETEEHARFASSLNNRPTQQSVEEYERELKALRTQQKKDRRDADEVTHVMIQECQQLLKLFGLPYITAPMEAEAQCAELVSLGLVDGIVTDDSDIFLFGGTRVYKNMFNQAKFVECYLTSDLERDFDLTRDKLINIAHLLGSDYTEGLPGVGPVTALEILSEFPGGLDEFRDWFTAIQQGAPMSEEDRQSSFRKKFRKQATKLLLPPSFPDRRVDMAYHKPEVDSDPSPFQWGVPNLDALRSFLMSTIGWDQARTDEVLVPVIRDMNRRENEGTQANITNFMGGAVGAGAFAPRVRAEGKSRRMEMALERLAGRARAKRKAGVLDEVEPTEGAADDAVNGGTGDAPSKQGLQSPRSQTRRRRRHGANASHSQGGPAEKGGVPTEKANDSLDEAPPQKKHGSKGGRGKRRRAE